MVGKATWCLCWMEVVGTQWNSRGTHKLNRTSLLQKKKNLLFPFLFQQSYLQPSGLPRSTRVPTSVCEITYSSMFNLLNIFSSKFYFSGEDLFSNKSFSMKIQMRIFFLITLFPWKDSSPCTEIKKVFRLRLSVIPFLIRYPKAFFSMELLNQPDIEAKQIIWN